MNLAKSKRPEGKLMRAGKAFYDDGQVAKFTYEHHDDDDRVLWRVVFHKLRHREKK